MANLRKSAVLLLVMSIFSALFYHPAESQGVDGASIFIRSSEEMLPRARAKLEDIALGIEDLKTKANAVYDNDRDLAELLRSANGYQRDAEEIMKDLDLRYTSIAERARLLENSDGISFQTTKSELASLKAQFSTVLADADLIKAQVNNLVQGIASLRSQSYLDRIVRHTELTSKIFSDSLKGINSVLDALGPSIYNSSDFMWRFKRKSILITILIVAVTIASGIFLTKLFVEPRLPNPRTVAIPTPLVRSARAFWSFLFYSIAICMIAMIILGTIWILNVLRFDLFEIFRAIIWSIVFCYLVFKLSSLILSPRDSKWRAVSISDRQSQVLMIFVVLLSFVTAAYMIFYQINVTMDGPFVVIISFDILYSWIVAMLLSLVGVYFYWAYRPQSRKVARHSKLVATLLLCTGLALALLPFLGYARLSGFISFKLVLAGAVVGAMYAGFANAHALTQPGAVAATRIGTIAKRRLKLSDVRLDQISLLAGLLLCMAIVGLGVPLLLLQFGFQYIEIWDGFEKFVTRIQIAGVTISILGLLFGSGVFVIGYYTTKIFSIWLDSRVLGRSRVDVGVRNSVRTTVGYAGISIAAILGITAAGFDLSNVAIVAGALSLGIGFGLQNVVSNFVSGLILLIERPFKVGDWISTGDLNGIVMRISVRATEIETFQRQSIIVPNSQFINSAVSNWMLRPGCARSDLKIIFPISKDPLVVVADLNAIVAREPAILQDPLPSLTLVEFDTETQTFEIRFFVDNPLLAEDVKARLRMAIRCLGVRAD